MAIKSEIEKHAQLNHYGRQHPAAFFPTKQQVGKTGLGLCMTNDTIKAHGGRINVKNSPGKGSTFTIYVEKQGQDGF